MVEMTGRLWLDTSKGKRTIQECIEAAQASYRRLEGCRATVCYIHAASYPDAPGEIDGVRILRLKNVLVHYYWMGRNGDPEPVEEDEDPPGDGEYHCQKCGTKWATPFAWCAECGFDGREAA